MPRASEPAAGRGGLVVPPGDTSGVKQAHALVADLASRCRADAAVLLAREGNNWRVMAVAGAGVGEIRTGDLFSTAQNPSLSPELGSARPPLPSEADPFLAALGPVALGDWITCPVMAGDQPVGLLHLVTSWSRPFSTDEVDTVVLGTGVAAALLSARAASGPAPPDTALREELARAVSLLHHDLRSPLNAILGFAGLLAEGGCDADQVARYAGIIAQGGETLAEMLDRVVVHLRALLGIHPWRPEEAPLAVHLAGLPAEGDLDRVVRWDGGAVADACRALLATVSALGGEAVVRARERDGIVHLAFGTACGEEADLGPKAGGIPTQFARAVFAAHGGTLRAVSDGTGFGVSLPAEPRAFGDGAPA